MSPYDESAVPNTGESCSAGGLFFTIKCYHQGMPPEKSPPEESPPGDLGLLLDFLNTGSPQSETETFSSPEALGAWLREHGLLPESTEPDPSDVDRVVAARSALLSLLNGADADPTAGFLLDLIATSAPCRVRFAADGSTRFDVGEDTVSGALGRLFSIFAVARVEKTWPRLKVCANEQCRRAFYDTSNNGSDKWCSLRRCGDKSNSLKYRRRKYRSRFGKSPQGGRPPG